MCEALTEFLAQAWLYCGPFGECTIRVVLFIHLWFVSLCLSLSLSLSFPFRYKEIAKMLSGKIEPVCTQQQNS